MTVVDDSLFGDENKNDTASGGSGKGGDSGGGDGKDGAAGAVAKVDPKDLEEAIVRTVGPAFGEIATALKTLHSRLPERPAAAASGEASGGESEVSKKLDRFLADPDAVVDERVRELLKEQKADPVLSAIVAGNQEKNLGEAQAAVDEEFGEGVWAEHFAKPVAQIMETFPPEFKVHRNGTMMAVDQVKGRLYRVLREKSREREKEMERTGAEGGGRQDFAVLPNSRQRPQPSTRLSDDEKKLLAAMEASGQKVSSERYLKMKNLDNTLESYLKATGKEGFLDGSA